jgi:hypothetical protein
MHPANVANFTLGPLCSMWDAPIMGNEMDEVRRIATALAAVTLLAVAAGCGGGGDPAPLPRPDGPVEPVPALRPLDYDRVDRARRDAEEAAWRRDQLARLEGHTSVPAALRRALLREAIGKHRHDAYLAAYRGARKAARMLDGPRQGEQAAVVASVDTLAARGQLVAGRMPAVFLNLRRNTRTWTTAPFPRAGERRTFGDSPAVFQYVPGQGIQLHQLATWGVVNARLRSCLRTPGHCPRRKLARRLDALTALAARRGRFVAWEYYYAYAQGSPPWISGMAQATAVQALARGAKVLRKPRYRRVVQHALGAFTTPPPAGVGVPAAGGSRYVMYSFAPSLQILNGELQAINGLRDAAVYGRSPLAARLVAAGDKAARATLRGFDTGAWSLYSAAGAESTLSYHQLTTRFLVDLCRRTEHGAYCDAARRFARYEREPPRIGIQPLRGLWARRAAPLRFSLSKGSAVQVRVYGPRGVVMARDLQLGRGEHDLTWTPPSRGRFDLRVRARGPEGRLGVSHRTVKVALPKPKPKPKRTARPPEREPAPKPVPRGTVGSGERAGGID